MFGYPLWSRNAAITKDFLEIIDYLEEENFKEDLWTNKGY